METTKLGAAREAVSGNANEMPATRTRTAMIAALLVRKANTESALGKAAVSGAIVQFGGGHSAISAQQRSASQISPIFNMTPGNMPACYERDTTNTVGARQAALVC